MKSDRRWKFAGMFPRVMFPAVNCDETCDKKNTHAMNIYTCAKKYGVFI